MKRKNTFELKTILLHIPVALWSIVVLFPLIITFFISFKDNSEYINTLPFLPPRSFLNIENYITTLIKGRILFSLRNSFILVFSGAILNALMGSMTAYCLNRFQFPLRSIIMKLYIVSAIIPGALLQVLIYRIMNYLGLTGTFGAPILLYAMPNIIQVWIYLQYFDNLPVSLDESAMMDGASYLRIFSTIIFPLLMPATATVLITWGVMIYNDMFIQYLYCSATKLHTATTALMAFSGPFAGNFNVLAAGCIAVMIPTLAMFLVLKQLIFSGLTVGAVKE